MQHIELIEMRRLMAVAGVDTTFADQGGLKLPGDYQVRNVLATNYLIFVDAYSPAVNGRYLLSYGGGGELRTNWGRRGRVSLPVLADPKLDGSMLAYDVHGGGVYIGDLPRNRPADFVTVQRVDNVGDIDRNYGNNGIYTFAETAELQGIVPLTKYGALLAVDRTAGDPSVDPNGDDTRYTTQLDLIRLTAYGQRDGTFGRRGIATINTGTFSSTYGDFGGSETSQHSDFADLQIRSDGSYRVLSLRNNHYYRQSFLGGDGGTYRTGSTNRESLDSQVFDSGGKLVAGQTQNYGLSSVKLTQNINAKDPSFYVPILAQVDGDGAIVVGGNGTRKFYTSVYFGNDYASAPNYTNVTALRLSPGKRTLEALPLIGNGVVSVARSGDGDLVVRTGKFFQHFSSNLVLDRTWGTRGAVAADDFTYPVTIDDEDRLLATRYENVIRIDG